VTHAAQNGPDFSFEGLLSLLKSLVHQVHHIIWSDVSSGRKRENKAKNSVIVEEKMQTNMIIVTNKDNKTADMVHVRFLVPLYRIHSLVGQ